MSDICTDNRFELIAKYKEKLIEATNIETSADEMAVIDNILFREWQMGWLDRLEQPTIDAVPVPDGGIGELSDGYHTFNGLYYQRMMLFAALVKTYKDRAWKSRRHSDGEPCFGGGWFIVGIDTPQGGYTYHYEDKYFDLFDCVELPNGKEWDGHTEDDVTRLLTLDAVPVVRCGECKHLTEITDYNGWCPRINDHIENFDWFCADGEREDGAE